MCVPEELKLQVVVSHLTWGLKIELRTAGKGVCALNHS